MTNEEKARRIMEAIDQDAYSIPWDHEEAVLKKITETLDQIDLEDVQRFIGYNRK